jgi:hypothetical protein
MSRCNLARDLWRYEFLKSLGLQGRQTEHEWKRSSIEEKED